MSVFAIVIPYEGAIELYATKALAEKALAESGNEQYGFYIEEMKVIG